MLLKKKLLARRDGHRTVIATSRVIATLIMTATEGVVRFPFFSLATLAFKKKMDAEDLEDEAAQYAFEAMREQDKGETLTSQFYVFFSRAARADC